MLEGKVALVTGASRGIGRAIALRLARDGCDVAVNYDRSEELAQRVSKDIERLGRNAITIKADVRNGVEIETMTRRTINELGKIDVLVNNAGIEFGEPCSFMQLTEDQWNVMFDVNVRSVFLCCRAIAPHMIRQGSGKIINISSGAGRIPSAYLAVYSATKAAMTALTQGIALELAPHGITANVILPGGVDTAMTGYEFHALEKCLGKPADQLRKNWESTIPLGQRLAKPEEIADVAAFLASDDSRYMTAATINVSGGLIY